MCWLTFWVVGFVFLAESLVWAGEDLAQALVLVGEVVGGGGVSGGETRFVAG